jgi:ribose transport system permease protein
VSDRPPLQTGSSTGTEAATSRRSTQLGQRLVAYRTAGVIGGLILMGTAWSLSSPFFLRTGNLLDISRQMSVLGLMAIGVTFVLISGQIDLSIGSTYGITAIVFALMVSSGTSVFIAFPLGLLLGAVVGAVNGLLCAYLKLPSFIVTLGMLQLLRGIALMMTDGAPVSLFGSQAFGFGAFTFLGVGKLFGFLPMQFVVLLVVATISAFVLNRTKHGLRLYSVGSSSRAALLAGIPIAWVQTSAFMVSGVLASLGGLLAVAFIPNATPTAGSGLEFDVFAAAVLGGVSLFGGEGSVTGAVLGAALLAVLRNGLVILGVSSFVQTALTGLVIIAAIAVNVVITSRRRTWR